MKRLLALFAASLFALTLAAQEKNFIDEPYIEVTGRAEMEVVPDRIYLRIVINEKDNKGKVSVEQQEKEMFKQLKSIGIDLEKQLSVQDMSSDLQTYFLRKNAILSTKAYQLEVNSAAQLGQAFEALQKAGISDVNIEKTDISNIEELRREIRVKAIQAAQKNAQVLAEAIGQEAQWAIYIQDYGFNMRPYANVLMTKSAMTMDAAAGVEESGPALEFEKTKIEHSVMARFVLKTTGWSGRK
ncbi:SIMPL domain-containing protein [uncultured Alistipes sp.]|uniref:SIMPL domain-containing protein n=1 Tax=uncultured Alistipes sp. TaxID=538949 RepID=UPI0026036E09|nr:SIMPL domain-containing protein [uncultured Alistipes sp.]